MATVGPQSQFAKSYNSFSGVDIKGVFANQVVAELQAISYSVTREKAPLYTMGAADPRSFSRGKRGIAGTLIFLMFDRHVLLGHFGIYADEKSGKVLPFLSDKDDPRPHSDGAKGSSDISIAAQVDAAGAGLPIQAAESGLDTVGGDQQISAPWYADQIPPFDITLAAANEYGALAVMSVVGVEILNEGYGVSIDDIVSEMQNTYVARSIAPWRPVTNSEVRGIGIVQNAKPSSLPSGAT